MHRRWRSCAGAWRADEIFEAGCSFREYLMGIRMEKARQLARSGEHSLVEISQLVGYRDYAQFSKMYKKYHGISPSTDSQSAKKHK